MSAISVAWNESNVTPAQSLQESMLTALAPYGAGRSFSWSDRNISLGGTLSGFLPEDQFDHQPLWAPDRSFCLVADIRLDNRADLARELNLVHPEELADSAFLLAAWTRWGAACLDRLAGGFAFAVWTPARRELFAARDHVGERPLFYHRSPGLFALASMPKGLLALPGVSSGFHEPRIAEWLACIQPDRSSTFFDGIVRVPPGHLLRVTPDSFETRQYWHPANARPTRFKRDQDYADALLEVLDRATEARLRSVTPIASQLSGGLDSSSVTASAARLLAARGQRLTAFTSVPRPGFNGITEPWFLAHEGPAAAETAALYPNIDHVLIDSRGYDFLSTMRTWTAAMDEPAVNIVNLMWLQAIFDQARQRGIGVVLEGVMGNETFSWESWQILARLFRRGRWIKLAKTTTSLRRHGDISFKAAARSATLGILPAWLDRRLIPTQELDNLYRSLANPEMVRRHDLNARTLAYTYYRAPTPEAERNLFFERFDVGSYHAAVQAVSGVELRDPAGDRRVFEYCFSIPVEQYIAEGHSRSLARRAMKGRLPDSTRLRYARGHQGADWYLPISDALPQLRGELKSLQHSPAASSALDLPGINDLLETWPQSGFHTKQVSFPWHFSLTRAFSMGSFLRSHEPAPVPTQSTSTGSPEISALRKTPPVK